MQKTNRFALCVALMAVACGAAASAAETQLLGYSPARETTRGIRAPDSQAVEDLCGGSGALPLAYIIQ